MKKLLSIVLIVLISGFTNVYAIDSEKIDTLMNSFYSKLDANIFESDKKILKINSLIKKVQAIKEGKWDKLPSSTQELISHLEQELKNQLGVYVEEYSEINEIPEIDQLNFINEFGMINELDFIKEEIDLLKLLSIIDFNDNDCTNNIKKIDLVNTGSINMIKESTKEIYEEHDLSNIYNID